MSQPAPTECERFPKCPYCGSVDDDPHELFRRDDYVETQCQNCDKMIGIARCVLVHYDVKPLEPDDEPSIEPE